MARDDEKAMVGPLKKVVLLLETGAQEDRPDFAPGPIQSTFIYGLGVSGLAPLELAIAGKREGDQCVLRLGRNALTDFFQHLFIPPLGIPETVEEFSLKITVSEISMPDQREMIRAMAELANCGDHCCG